MSFVLILGVCFVAVVPLFECIFCTTYVGLCGVFVLVSLCGDSCLVYDCLLQALSVDRTVFSFSAVAGFGVLVVSFVICAFFG